MRKETLATSGVLGLSVLIASCCIGSTLFLLFGVSVGASADFEAANCESCAQAGAVPSDEVSNAVAAKINAHAKYARGRSIILFISLTALKSL